MKGKWLTRIALIVSIMSLIVQGIAMYGRTPEVTQIFSFATTIYMVWLVAVYLPKKEKADKDDAE